MKKIKEVFGVIKKIYKNPRGKAFLFFGVYFFFFLFLIITIRIGVNHNSNIEDKIPDTDDIIVIDNYKFNYNIYIDNDNYNYVGEVSGKISLFNYKDNQYYKTDSLYYLKKGDSLEVVDDPYIYHELFNIENLNTLLKLSTKESTTNYEDGRVVYNYLLSTTTIVKYIEMMEVDLDDVPNMISITYRDNVLEEVNIDVSSYGKYRKMCKESVKLSAKFTDHDKVSIRDISY